MQYTISPATLRNLAEEFKADLENTYENLNSEAISLSDLEYWEKRRRALLHQYGRALLFAQDLEWLNTLQAERTNEQLERSFREAAE